MADSKGNYTTISIPTPLAEKIKKRLEGTGFNSVSSYVTYILRQVLSSMEQDDTPKKQAFSSKEEKVVKDRLKALGYLD